VGERLPGLPLDTFLARYGASCRTKNVVVVPETRAGRLRLATSFLLGRVDPGEGRAYPLPSESRLPTGFIRLDPWEAEYLYLCAQEATIGIVEVGRFHGGSTFLLACANARVPIWSVDLEPQNDARLEQLLADESVGRNVTLVVGDSHRDELPEIGSFDLLFVDGDHSYEGCLGDLERFVPRLAPRGQIVLHDCRAESDVQRAVLDFARDTPLDVVRSPHVPRRHWLTPYGSMAHFVKPAQRLPALSSVRPRLVAAAVGLLTLVFFLAAILPEELGDKPYNVF
jgi:predicted O-methyltransferase YrrM